MSLWVLGVVLGPWCVVSACVMFLRLLCCGVAVHMCVPAVVVVVFNQRDRREVTLRLIIQRGF